MNFLSRLWNRIAGKSDDGEVHQTVVYVGRQPVIFTGEFYDSNYADQQDVNIAVCVGVISNSIAGLPLDVMKIDVVDGKEELEDDNEHPVNTLIQEPNQYHTERDIIQHLVQSLIVCANGYLLPAKNKSLEPNELWPVQPWALRLMRDKNTGMPQYYQQGEGQNKKIYQLDEVVHLRSYHMSDPFWGGPAVKPVKEQVESNKYAVDYNKQFFRNGATPDILFEDTSIGGIFTGEKGEEKQEAFFASWDKRLKGTKNAHKRGILPPGLKATVVNQSMKDMTFGELLKLNREQIYAFFRVPPSVGGVYEYANYANALIQEKSFWEHSLIPMIHLIEAGLTKQLVWRYFDKDHVIKFDLSGVKALQEDQLAQAQRLSVLVNGKIISQNEARQELGMEVWPEEEFNRPQQIDISGFLTDESGEGDSNTGGDVRSVTRNSLRVKRLVTSSRYKADLDSPRYKRWKAIDDRRKEFEIRFAKVMSKFFTEQRNRVIAKVRKKTDNGRFMSMLALNHKDDLPDDAGQIFDMIAENAALESVVRPFSKDAMRRAGQQALIEAGLDAAFNVENPQVFDVLERLWNRSKLINDTTFEYIRDLLEETYKQGWSLSKFELELRKEFKEFSVNRSQVIARTEMGGILNGGAESAYDQAGIEMKQWLATQDEYTRDAHSEADGQKAKVGQPFIVGGEMMYYPGDANASAGNTVNCRCAVVAYFGDD